MKTSQSTAAIFAALSKAQSKIEGSEKDAKNPFFNSQYSTLSSVWKACKSALTENDLSVSQVFETTDKGTLLVTVLGHSSGEWISGSILLNPVKDDPQGMGSAISYYRRYSLAAMVGVAPEDDDGNLASHKPEPSKAREAIKKLVEDNPMEPVTPAATQPDPEVDQEPRTWQETKVHLGKKYIGKTLGELEVHAIEEIYNSFNPKPKNGHMDLRDVYLKHALTMWKKEMDTLV